MLIVLIFLFSALRTGPFNFVLMLANLLTSVILKIATNSSKKKLYHERGQTCEKYGLLMIRSIITMSITIGFSIVISKEDVFDTFLFFGLVLYVVNNLCLYYYIKTTPNLYNYAHRVSNGMFDYLFVQSVLKHIKYTEETLIDMIRFLFSLDINYPKVPSPKINVMLL